MENIYNKYYLSDENTLEMLKNAIVILDTSALLDLYYYSETTLNMIFENVFEYLKDRLWIPAQVYFEFLKNKDVVAVKPAQTYEALLEKTQNRTDGGHIANIKKISEGLDKKEFVELKNQFKTLKEKTKISDKHPYINQDEFNSIDFDIATFESQINEFQERINIFIDNFTSLINEKANSVNCNVDDMISKMVIDKFSIGEEFTYSQMMYIVKEGEFRYKEEIPPGYEDAKNKIGMQKYGDLFVWKQILIYAKKRKKDVLLITNDVKEDWFDANIQAPRFELLKEFNSETGKHFWAFNMKSFLYKMNLLLDSAEQVSEEAIAEVDVIQNEKNKVYVDLDLYYYEFLLQNLWCLEFDIGKDAIEEVPLDTDWKLEGKSYLYKVIKEDGRKIITLVNKVRGANYTSALLPLRNIFKIKRHFEDLGEKFEYYLFIIAPTHSSAYALTRQLGRDNVKFLYENLEVKSHIGYIDKDEIAILACNYAAG